MYKRKRSARHSLPAAATMTQSCRVFCCRSLAAACLPSALRLVRQRRMQDACETLRAIPASHCCIASASRYRAEGMVSLSPAPTAESCSCSSVSSVATNKENGRFCGTKNAMQGWVAADSAALNNCLWQLRPAPCSCPRLWNTSDANRKKGSSPPVAVRRKAAGGRAQVRAS